MKTVFVTAFHPLISRNILQPFLAHPLSKGVKIVLLIPLNKKKFFEDAFGKFDVIIEAVGSGFSWGDKILRFFSLAALATRTMEIKRRTELRGRGLILSKFIGGTDFGLHLVRFLDTILISGKEYQHLFSKHRPDILFSTDIQNEADVKLMRAARDSGIKVISMVRSWDNLTSKGIIRNLPDLLLLQNKIIKKEAEEFGQIPEGRIEVVGVPHYDFYLAGGESSREEFFKTVGFDPRKRLVLYAPVGDRYLNYDLDVQIVDIMDKFLPGDVSILVRLPPTDTVRGLEPGVRGRVAVERPGSDFKTPKNTELLLTDECRLRDSLHWADVVVSGPSTIAVDAAFFDKPVVLVGFDGNEKKDYYESVLRYYDYNQWQPVLKSGGVRLAKNEEDFLNYLNAYLKDPALDREGRKKIIQEEACFLDGRSTERLARAILASL